MSWHLTDDLDTFLRSAGGFLAAHPAENTVLLTVADAARGLGPRAFGGSSPWYGWWSPADGAAVAGACLRTPPFPVALGRMPGIAAEELAAVLVGRDEAVDAVGGATGAATAFAGAWRTVTGGGTEIRRRERLYRLAALTGPQPAPPGAARVARPEDQALIVEWHEAFSREAGTLLRDFTDGVARRIARGGFHLWEDGGRPVALAGANEAAGMVRIGPVYTPPQSRRRGYAAGVTAAATAQALADGAREVLLFTDLANPTSNALYQRLGYRPVGDRLVLGLAV
ncbi:GNAT family N-acetyltransferase [Peterkaempfera sp. SMS 1(5)a]|uniref:GNAT family N-acetyltransferase n=1 Tax=Peterkaempfera podocarpi TaxID=3232308 RepID=UPI00366AC570